MDFSQFDRGVFLVNVLGVVYDTKTKMILIGRRENDPFIKELTWCLPGGRLGHEESLTHYLKKEVKKKTCLDINVKKLILARTPPENREILLLYFYCEASGGEAKAGDKFVEVKWIKPGEAGSYFQTSIDPVLLEFLDSLK